jgi:hypothetical protein
MRRTKSGSVNRAYEALALRKRLAVFTVADNQLGVNNR